MVDSILDWRDPDELKRGHGAENDYYRKRRPPYTAKNGFFDSPEELLLVRGMTADLFYGHDDVPGLRDVVSAYSKSRKLNLRTTSAACYRSCGTAGDAQDLISQRDGDTADGFGAGGGRSSSRSGMLNRSTRPSASPSATSRRG